MKSGGENCSPDFGSSSFFAGQVFNFELMLTDLLYQFNATDGYRCRIEPLELEASNV